MIIELWGSTASDYLFSYEIRASIKLILLDLASGSLQLDCEPLIKLLFPPARLLRPVWNADVSTSCSEQPGWRNLSNWSNKADCEAEEGLGSLSCL